MRVPILPLTFVVATSALIVSLRELPSDINKREIQGNNGDESPLLNERIEPADERSDQLNDERRADTESVKVPSVPNDPKRKETSTTNFDPRSETPDAQSDPLPPLPRSLRSVFEKQVILKALDELISYRADLVVQGRELFDNSLDRYPTSLPLATVLPTILATQFSTADQPRLSDDRVVAMQFSQPETRELEQHMEAIVSFVRENVQPGAAAQVPEQLIALAEDQTLLLAVKQRLDGFDPDQLASYLIEQNPFLREERAAEIVKMVEDKYAPLTENDKKSSVMRRIKKWWDDFLSMYTRKR